MSDTLEVQLLHAGLLCGLGPEGPPIYRMQLYFVANALLGSSSHQSDFQRALQTAVDQKKWFDNYGDRGEGEYVLTDIGHPFALAQCGQVKPALKPMRRKDFRVTISVRIKSLEIQLITRGADTKVSINGQPVRYATEACRRVEVVTGIALPTKGTSAVRVLQDLAIDHRAQIKFT